MEPLSFDPVVERLRQRLAGPLPGAAAQLAMAPETRQDRSLLEVRDKPCREAAVLMLLFPLDEIPAVVLTVRPDYMAQHAGQISFPGGRREPGETLEETALREAHEEVGLDPSTVEVLGPLTPLYIPPSNYCVYPFAALTRAVPDLRPCDEEVAGILRVPIPHLLDPDRKTREQWTLRGRRMAVPCYVIDTHRVWGATAMMLAELLSLFEG